MGGSDLGSWGEFAEDCSTLRLLPLDLAHMGTDNPARKVSEHIKMWPRGSGGESQGQGGPDVFLLDPSGKA